MIPSAHPNDALMNRARLNAYAEALRANVTPDKAVLDLGAGAGFLSLLACHFGARRVYAVEESPLIELLHDSARDNGLEDRLVVLQTRARDVRLPERVDLLVSGVDGGLAFDHRRVNDLIHARGRLLAP